MKRTSRRLIMLVAATSLVAAACGSDDDNSSDGSAAADTAAAEDMASAPASVVAEEQTSDGSTIVVASVTLPSAGFIAVHGDGGGSPGAVVGNSDLLPAGESTDVTITLDEPLTESGVVFPMAHIDIDGNGEYEFAPPDAATDTPAATESGDVAVVSVTFTLE